MAIVWPYYIVNQWLITQMDINSHPFRSDARQVVRHVVEAEMGSHYIVSPPFDLVGCFKDDLWLGLEDGQWPALRRNIKVLQVVKIGFQDVWDEPIRIAVEYIYILYIYNYLQLFYMCNIYIYIFIVMYIYVYIHSTHYLCSYIPMHIKVNITSCLTGLI